MIRINLIEHSKKGRRSSPSTRESQAALYLVVMAVGWFGLAGVGYWMLDTLEKETENLQAQSKANRKRSEEIRKLIDEEALLARQKKVEDLRNAIKSVESQRRSPVFVMHELANVMSTGKMPDVDEERQRRLETTDPQSRLNPSWDASSVWLTSLRTKGDSTLQISGSTRDPADLDEFLKRMRSSIRFHNISHPKFDARSSRSGGSETSRVYNFNFKAKVAFWD